MRKWQAQPRAGARIVKQENYLYLEHYTIQWNQHNPKFHEFIELTRACKPYLNGRFKLHNFGTIFTTQHNLLKPIRL